MLRHARRIVGAVADARRAVATRFDDIAGELNLGVTRMVSGYCLADFLSRFRRAYSRVAIRTIEEERGYLEHLLVNGEIDVGLLLISNLTNRQALETELLVRSPWRVWLPSRHPLLSASVLTLAEVAAEGVIMLTTDELAETTTRCWSQAGLSPNVVMRTSSVEAVRSLVGTGLGLATLPDRPTGPGRSKAIGWRRATSATRSGSPMRRSTCRGPSPNSASPTPTSSPRPSSTPPWRC